MEVDVRRFNFVPMRLDKLEEYMLDDSYNDDEMGFYDGSEEHDLERISWQGSSTSLLSKESSFQSASSPTLSRSSVGNAPESFDGGKRFYDYTACSPALSRSSLGSLSFCPNVQAVGPQFNRSSSGPSSYRRWQSAPTGASSLRSVVMAHDLCSESPLSEITRICSSTSLQSFGTDDLEYSHGLSMYSDLTVHSNPSVTSSQVSMSSDPLTSMMDMMLQVSNVGMMPDLPPIKTFDHEQNFSGSFRDACDATFTMSRSSPTSPFDLGDEDHESPLAVYTDDDDIELNLNTLTMQEDFDKKLRSLESGIDHEGIYQSLSQAHLVLTTEREQSECSENLLHQYFPSHIPFENCHSLNESLDLEAHTVPNEGIMSEDDLNGIRLMHLLLAGAEAAASANADLASVILSRLKEVVSRTGSTMQRVAAYFSEGLQQRIDGVVRGPEKAVEPQKESLSAFQVLYEVSPYIKFAHFTANQAILEAFEGERRVHIIDYNILEGIQWPSLIQALASRRGGPPHLRITALCRPHVKRAVAMTQETGRRLNEFAATFNVPFTFHQVRVDNEDEFRSTLLKQVKGECLAVNCMLQLPHMPHRSKKGVSSFFRAVHRLNPRVLTLVEEELSCSTPTFVSHFLEALQHYTVLFDSLESTTLSVDDKRRQLVEKIFISPKISSLMTTSNSDRPGLIVENESIHWHSLAQSAGFHPVPLTGYNLSQAKLLLALFNDGFKVEESKSRLLLSWRSKPIVGASVWQCIQYM